MNSDRIQSLLKNDPECRDLFLGVYSRDNLPSDLPGDPRLLVCNTDPRGKEGSHWISMFLGPRGEYFDSFGRPPDTHFRRYMDDNCHTWTFNDKQLQSVISSYCGHYCVFYCMYRCRGVDVKKLSGLFTKDTGFNDCIVHEFVCGRPMSQNKMH